MLLVLTQCCVKTVSNQELKPETDQLLRLQGSVSMWPSKPEVRNRVCFDSYLFRQNTNKNNTFKILIYPTYMFNYMIDWTFNPPTPRTCILTLNWLIYGIPVDF